MENQIINGKEELSPEAEALITEIKERALNLYMTRQMFCSEAVLTAMNKGLGGGLTDDVAIAMSAPFGVALGGSGCICGALSGAVMACGLFLGQNNAYRHRREIRESANQIHDAFKAANRSTCCRVLTKKVKHDKKIHFEHCSGLTAQGAELAARMVLKKRPELVMMANNDFLAIRQSRIGAVLARMGKFFSH